MVGAILALTGCSLMAPNYTPDYPTLQNLKKSGATPLAVDEVQPRNAKAAVNNITLRGSPLKAKEGTFAQYLENALVSDLKEVDLYDKASSTHLQATVLKNDIDVVGIFTGSGVFEARIKVTRGEVIKLDKTYHSEIQFESSFLGGVAIPKGQSEYANLIRSFLEELYADPEFNLALKN